MALSEEQKRSFKEAVERAKAAQSSSAAAPAAAPAAPAAPFFGGLQAPPGEAPREIDPAQMLRTGAERTGEFLATPVPGIPSELGEGLKMAAGTALPTLLSGAAVVTGGPFLETAVDVTSYGLSVALGLEPFSYTQLALALATPGVPRTAVRAFRRIIKNPALNFARQERLLDLKSITSDNVKLLLNDFDFRVGTKKAAIVEAQRGVEAMLDASLRSGADAYRTSIRNIPTPSDATVRALYQKVNDLNVEIPTRPLRLFQSELAARVQSVSQISPALVPDAIRGFATSPDLSKIDETIPFQAFRDALTSVGQEVRALSQSGAEGAGQRVHILNQYRDALQDTLQQAANSSSLTKQAKNALNAANSAYFVQRSMEELGNFMVPFVTRTADGTAEVLDARQALAKLDDFRDLESRALRSRLEQMKVLQPFEEFLTKLRAIQEKAAEETQAFAEGLRDLANVSRQRALVSGSFRRDLLQMAPSPRQRIPPQDTSNAFRVAFFGASAASGAAHLAGFEGLFPLFAGTASIAMTPYVVSGLLRTRTGRRLLLRRLDETKGRFTLPLVGAAGAMVRALSVQISQARDQEMHNLQLQPAQR